MKKRGSKKPKRQRTRSDITRKAPRKDRGPKRQEISFDELSGIVERARTGALNEDEYEKLKGAVETLAFMTHELEAKGTSIRRLRRLIFGASTEKTSQVFKGDGEKGGEESHTDKDGKTQGTGAAPQEEEDKDKDKKKKKRKGHGRNGASDYKGADKVKIPHESLNSGDLCPGCEKGKVYVQKEPAMLVRVKGMAPLIATVYELERLRCNLCGEVFTAKAPEGVGEEKYDETSKSMIALLKYGCGMPFNRLENLEKSLGIPLPSSTQWGEVEDAAKKLFVVHNEFIDQAAQGKVLHNDDTGAKILELIGQSRNEAMNDEKSSERTGVFTSGIVSVKDSHKIALFFTGPKHAGENLETVLSRRKEELGPPIQMCDLLSRNTSGDFETIVAGCILHSRRKYIEVANGFPDEVLHVLEELKIVYQHDAFARKEKMSDEERLKYHQTHSGPVMERLKKWLQEQFDDKNTEPNSGLGDAIKFMQRHWDKLTLFLKVAGAPLDNNICERAIKKVILHRKNALFFKTQNGARVGDLFMSLIHTAELNKANPFDYLVALLRNSKTVAENPADWMPWNYKETLANITQRNLAE